MTARLGREAVDVAPALSFAVELGEVAPASVFALRDRRRRVRLRHAWVGGGSNGFAGVGVFVDWKRPGSRLRGTRPPRGRQPRSRRGRRHSAIVCPESDVCLPRATAQCDYRRAPTAKHPARHDRTRVIQASWTERAGELIPMLVRRGVVKSFGGLLLLAAGGRLRLGRVGDVPSWRLRRRGLRRSLLRGMASPFWVTRLRRRYSAVAWRCRIAFSKRVEGSKMTDAEAPVERQELSERLLGLIGGYRMGVSAQRPRPVHEDHAGVSAAGPGHGGRQTPPPHCIAVSDGGNANVPPSAACDHKRLDSRTRGVGVALRAADLTRRRNRKADTRTQLRAPRRRTERPHIS